MVNSIIDRFTKEEEEGDEDGGGGGMGDVEKGVSLVTIVKLHNIRTPPMNDCCFLILSSLSMTERTVYLD